MKTLKDFYEFLQDYKVIGLAIAFIIGAASNQLVRSLVDNIIMPLVTPFIPGGTWHQATLTLGPFVFTWGRFVADLIYFVIVAFVVFIIAKKLLKEEKVKKK